MEKIKVSLFACVLLLSGCQKDIPSVQATNLTRAQTCSIDGMILLDHAGPKAQIVWQDGTRSFYCEAREAFPDWLDPIKRNRIEAFFVQDFAGQPWAAHKDNWMDAHKAVFVVDSRKQGAMGVSYVSFGTEMGAHKFVQQQGGKILGLEQIDDSVLARSSRLQRERMTKGMTKGMTRDAMQGHAIKGHPMGRHMQGHDMGPDMLTAPVTSNTMPTHHTR